MRTMIALLVAAPAFAGPFVPYVPPQPRPVCAVPAHFAQNLCEDGLKWSNRDCMCIPDFLEPAPERNIGFVEVELEEPEPWCPTVPQPGLGDTPVYVALGGGVFAATTADQLEEYAGRTRWELAETSELTESPMEHAAERLDHGSP